jgi:hypothetical protein
MIEREGSSDVPGDGPVASEVSWQNTTCHNVVRRVWVGAAKKDDSVGSCGRLAEGFPESR